MRVKYPGILRNAGARIQLSFTTDLDFYAKKIDSIRFNREFIQLSPVELAYEIIENACASYFHGIAWMAVWAELGFPQNDRADVAALARRLGALFSRAINHANDHPMGPVHFVPNCIKELIRFYVKGHAFITTDELRSREHYRGRFRGSSRL